MPRKTSTPVAESTTPSRVPASMVVRGRTGAAVDCPAMPTAPLNPASSVSPARRWRRCFTRLLFQRLGPVLHDDDWRGVVILNGDVHEKPSVSGDAIERS